mgnify:CR=1 FL=1
MIFEAPETFVFKTWIAQHLGMCQESRVLSKEHENRSKCIDFRQILSQMVKTLETAVGSGFNWPRKIFKTDFLDDKKIFPIFFKSFSKSFYLI